jgi:hypothetical protein
MVSLEQLWIPIVAAAVLVFAASSVIHMVLKWHARDYKGFPNEDAVRAAIRAGNPAPGQYFLPYCPDFKEMAKPEVMQKFTEGPIGMVVLRPPGAPSMGAPLAQWFVLNLVIAGLAAYLASRTLPAGASFLAVCRLVGTVVFLAYMGGSVSQAIWMGKPWASTAREGLDAFIYGLVCALTFAWLWPR